MPLEEVCNKYLDQVYRYVLYKVQNPHTAEDLTSQIFERIIKNYTKYKPEKASLTTWIYTIANNLVVDYYRKKKETTNEGIDEKQEQGKADSILLSTAVIAEVRKLETQAQLIIHLRFAEGLTHKEIATELGKSENALKVQFHRIIKDLKNNNNLKGLAL